MKGTALASVILVLLISQICCCGGSNGSYTPVNNNGDENPPPENPTDEPAESDIGSITRIRSYVWSGPENALSEVLSPCRLHNNESVRVTDGGKARLNFHNQVNLTLYNNTEMGGIYGELDPNTPNFVRMKLFRGGLLGEVTSKGSSTEISVGFGTTIHVVGTTFFVVYDEAGNYVSVGNFDGEVYVRPNGGDEIFLPQDTMMNIAPNGDVKMYELRSSPDTFNNAANNSAMEGWKTMLEEASQPLDRNEAAAPPSNIITTVLRGFVRNENGNYVPDLASDWSIDPDGYIIDFTLKPDNRLENGVPFTSSIAAKILSSEWRYAKDGRVEFILIDDYTIRFKLHESAAGFVLEEMSNFKFEIQLGGS
jgi:hypothetical protein